MTTAGPERGAVLVIDAAERVVDANAEAIAVFGALDALRGRPIDDVLKQPVPATPAQVDLLALSVAGELQLQAWRCPLPDGRTAICLRDVTDQRCAESTLALVMAGVERSADAFAITDERGLVEYANPAHAIALGMLWFDVLGLPLWQGISTPDAERIERAVHKGARFFGEVISTHPDGSQHIHELTLAPTIDQHTGSRRFVVCRRDVTARALAQQELAQLRERVINADRDVALGHLAARIAHEMNNPAVFLLTNLELALEDLDSWRPGTAVTAVEIERIKAMLVDAREGSQRLTRLVKETVALTERAPPHRVTVALADVARDALRLTWPLARARAHLVEQLDVRALVRGDRLRVEQVVVNLIGTAARAIPAGSGDNALSIRTGEADGMAELVVSDSALTLPATLADALRAPPGTTQARVLGESVGLSISRDLAVELGGSLTAVRGDPSGTVFTLRLPIDRPTDRGAG